MLGPHSPRQNHLLAALPAPERERLYPHLELGPLPLGEVLYESVDQLQHVYFPIASIVALLMGGEAMSNRAVVQSAGYAYRLKGQLLKEEFNRSRELQHLLLRYTQALLTQ